MASRVEKLYISFLQKYKAFLMQQKGIFTIFAKKHINNQNIKNIRQKKHKLLNETCWRN